MKIIRHIISGLFLLSVLLLVAALITGLLKVLSGVTVGLLLIGGMGLFTLSMILALVLIMVEVHKSPGHSSAPKVQAFLDILFDLLFYFP